MTLIWDPSESLVCMEKDFERTSDLLPLGIGRSPVASTSAARLEDWAINSEYSSNACLFSSTESLLISASFLGTKTLASPLRTM